MGEPPTQMIPPVPPTPPEGFPVTPPPPRRRPRRDNSEVSIALLLAVAVVALIFAALVSFRLTREMDEAKDRLIARSTEQLMDWNVARMADRDVREVCRGWRSPEWRTDIGDRFQVQLATQMPNPNRAAIDGYLDRMCAPESDRPQRVASS